jgi:predicted phage terminase large subunit-like protein
MGRGFSVKEFRLGLAELSVQLRKIIEAQVLGFDPDPAKSADRREKALESLEAFARTYFPHYIQYDNSVVHDFLYSELPALLESSRGEHEAIAAPRGEAKSTLVSQIFVLWCVARKIKHYPLIIMDSYDQAAMMIEAIKAELEFNPRLSQDFPEICGQGRVWREGLIVTANDIKIQGAGSGKKLRGLRHGPYRPDLVICDDLENDENVVSLEQRDKTERWLNRTVLNLGPPDGSMDVIVIGTVLHYDSVLSRVLKNPLWKTRVFRSVIEWPDRMDLWEKWEELLLNDGDAAAESFYRLRKKEMERGAVVSWPSARPLIMLMTKRARDGHASFDAEQQNDPISSEDALFSKIVFWVSRSDSWLFYGACDPSLGKQGSGRDPSAILVGGFDRKTGVLDVVEAAIARRLPDKIIEDVISLQREYRCLVWGIEAVQFQEFLRTELVKRSARVGVPVPARALIPHADKMLRIESMQPHVVNGLIRLHPSQKVLLQQLRHFPKADHDDGPDALQMLWMLAVSGSASYAYESVGSGYGSGLRKDKGAW